MEENKKIQIYRNKSGDTELRVNIENETVWLDSYQIAEIFWKDRTTIQRHIKNIYSTWELIEKETCAKNAHVQKEWSKNVKREKINYNLDMIISVWYKVNSKEATQFRIWATSVLKDHIVQWYSINEKRLKQREKWLEELEWTLWIIKKAISSWNLSQDEALGLLDIISDYTNSWLLLQRYDEDELIEQGKTKKLDYKLEAEEAYKAILELKKNLMEKHEATDLFANLREFDGLQGIFGNIYQTFDKKELYLSTEEKAAHLLYFIVKDHPFSDGNKRSGAFLFILFLAQNRLLFDENKNKKIDERSLVAITLLIAESHPKDKELMTRLVVNLIN